eukprot:4653149-Lingulodinium_polyedra.AAC.1
MDSNGLLRSGTDSSGYQWSRVDASGRQWTPLNTGAIGLLWNPMASTELPDSRVFRWAPVGSKNG